MIQRLILFLGLPIIPEILFRDPSRSDADKTFLALF